MKRSFQEDHQSIAMANCLVLLSQGRDNLNTTIEDNFNNTNPDRVFECKTCNRTFPSFQALGGHRASHKKPKLTISSGGSNGQDLPAVKPKTHECSICGLEFTIGQALGGHMRRHRSGNARTDDDNNDKSNNSENNDSKEFAVVKKSSRSRISCLDLNLTPFENDLEMFKTQKLASIIDFIL